MPAKPVERERLITMTSLASETSMIGIPAIGELGSFFAAGLVTSFAPITTATSICGISGLISSISLSCSYGTSASASRTFMWPGIRPATGWIA